MVKIGGIQKFSTVDYPGHVVASIFTIGCNMRCGYCHNPELVLPERFAAEIPERQVMDFLKTRIGLLDGVAISGGEPTVQDDLVEFIKKIKDLGFKVKLDSNGTNPQMLRELIDGKMVDFIAMDVKGPIEKYTQIAARPINIDAIKESIELIKTIPHEFRTTVVKGQLEVEDFHGIGELVDGADRFALQYFVPGVVVSTQFKNKQSFSEDEMNQARKIILGHVKECVIH